MLFVHHQRVALFTVVLHWKTVKSDPSLSQTNTVEGEPYEKEKKYVGLESL